MPNMNETTGPVAVSAPAPMPALDMPMASSKQIGVPCRKRGCVGEAVLYASRVFRQYPPWMKKNFHRRYYKCVICGWTFSKDTPED